MAYKFDSFVEVPNSVPRPLVDMAKRYTPDSYPQKAWDGYVVAYVEGHCLDIGRESARAGLGVWFGEGHPLLVMGNVFFLVICSNQFCRAAIDAHF
jgi:hypothetical protein